MHMKNDSIIYFIKHGGSLSLRTVIAALAFLIIIPTEAVYADIYKYVDNEGVLHLTNVPSIPNAKYVLILREKRILFQSNIDVNKFDHIISNAAKKFRIDSALIKAIIKAESNFNHEAISPVGAQGLMQLMPATAYALQVEDAFHPENNIEGGTRYLRYLLNTYRGNLKLTLAAYNAGERAVAKYNNNVPPYRETQNYIRRVLSYYAWFSKK
jgi:soluble lytic murein transglycosylase-like protein